MGMKQFFFLIDAKVIDVAQPIWLSDLRPKHKLKIGLKTQKMHFLPIIELTSESLMAL
jgi:hypothetical protein